jgi:hypothetical protein
MHGCSTTGNVQHGMNVSTCWEIRRMPSACWFSQLFTHQIYEVRSIVIHERKQSPILMQVTLLSTLVRRFNATHPSIQRHAHIQTSARSVLSIFFDQIWAHPCLICMEKVTAMTISCYTYMTPGPYFRKSISFIIKFKPCQNKK